MSQSFCDIIPVMNLLQEMREQDYQVICTKPHLYCKIFEDNLGALELARLPDLRPWTKHINVCYHHFAHMCKRGLSRYSLLTQKTRLLMHLRKLWHKMTFNIITATCVASNLHKQLKWGSVVYLKYFGTYLGYLPSNPISQHSDTFPANPSWIPYTPRHCLLQN